MTKNELIKKLQSIEGNPVVLLNGEGADFLALKGVKFEKMHQSKSEPGEYIEDYEFKGEVCYNTYCHENYNEKSKNVFCLLYMNDKIWY